MVWGFVVGMFDMTWGFVVLFDCVILFACLICLGLPSDCLFLVVVFVGVDASGCDG